jgi:oligopeptide transport system substrate-binding protein
MIHRRSSLKLLAWAGLFLTLLLCSCEQPERPAEQAATGTTAKEQRRAGGIYRTPLLNNPATLDPAYVLDEYSAAVVQQLFDGLVRFDPYLLVLPALAESWRIEDNGRRYRFVLQEGARFHNGAPVTAEDVVFSLSRLLRIDPSPPALPHLLKITGARAYREQTSETVAGLRALDKGVVLVELDEPHAPFLTALGMYQAKIVPETEVISLGDDFGRNPVGSGPFRFVSWEANTRITLARNPEYFGASSYLDEVEYAIFPGVGVDQLLADFEGGGLDEMPVLGGVRQELSGVEGLQWFHRPALWLMFYGIRGDHPPLDDPGFRRRLSATLDRERIIDQVYSGQFDPATRILPPGMPGVSQKNFHEYEETRHLQNDTDDSPTMAAPKRISLEIVSTSNSSFAQTELSLVREAWAKLGVELRIKYITDWPEFEAYIDSDSVQLYRYSWSSSMPDADSFLHPLFNSEGAGNFMRFKNERIDNMLQSARGENDPGKRAAMYGEIEAAIMAETPIIPLRFNSVDRVYKPYVRDAQPSALGAHYMSLHQVWFDLDAQKSR